MKKILYTLALIFLFIIDVNAMDYKIENYKIDITVLEDGNLKVQEAFNMNGLYNGYERIIYYKNNYNDYLGNLISSVENNKIYNGSGITLKEVRAINFDLDSDFLYLQQNGDLFKKTNNASKGDYGVYTIDKIENGEKYKIYNSSIMNKDFYINYILEDVGISHADISEIPFNISGFKESIANLDIYIHILDNKELLNAWVHNIKSNVEIIDINTIKINIKDIQEDDLFDFRIICDRNDNYTKKTNEIVYNKILKIEEDINLLNGLKNEEYESLRSLSYDSVLEVEKSLNRDDYNFAFEIVSSLNETDNLKTELLVRLINVESRILRKEMLTKLFYTSILFFWFVCLIIITYHIYKKYDKEYKVIFKPKKIDYIPSDISVSSVGYLLRKKVNNNDLKASILKLIYNGNIRFSRLNNDFILRKESIANLKESDLRIMKLLFEDKNMIKFSKLKEKIKNNYKIFIDNYSNWITKATIEAEELEYYEDILLPKILGIILSIVGFILGILFNKYDTYFSPHIVVICSILSFIYFILLEKRTAKGDEEIVKWRAFKNYLDNYNKNTKEIKLEEMNEFLIYSIVFNNYDKLSKYMKSQLRDTNIRKYKNFLKYLYVDDSIIKAVDKLLSKAYSEKNIDKIG